MMNSIGRVLADFARCNACNLVAAHVDVALLDGDVLVVVIPFDGQATVVNSRVARSHTVVLIIIVLEVVVSVYSIAIP